MDGGGSVGELGNYGTDRRISAYGEMKWDYIYTVMRSLHTYPYLVSKSKAYQLPSDRARTGAVNPPYVYLPAIASFTA